MSSSICENQKNFDKAIDKAIYHLHKQKKPSTLSKIISLIIIIIIIVWAITLALKVSQQNKHIHLIFALAFSPFYILSHYMNNIKN